MDTKSEARLAAIMVAARHPQEWAQARALLRLARTLVTIRQRRQQTR